MEPFRGDYCKLRAKAVSGHLTRDYPDKLRLFVTRAQETADKLQHDPLTLPSATCSRTCWSRKGNSTPPCSN